MESGKGGVGSLLGLLSYVWFETLLGWEQVGVGGEGQEEWIRAVRA